MEKEKIRFNIGGTSAGLCCEHSGIRCSTCDTVVNVCKCVRMCKLPCFALHCHHVVSRSTAALHTNKSPVFLFESGRKHQSELSDINKVSGMI